MTAEWETSRCPSCHSNDTSIIGDPLAGEVECSDCGSIYFVDKQTKVTRKKATV